MSDDSKQNVGAIAWHDLSVENADSVKDFYSEVIGWDISPVSMSDENGQYQDYSMNLAGTAETVAGVCHARGSNAKIPPQWVMYVGVADALKSVEQCLALGGSIIDGPREMGGATYFFIKDPAGAVLAIYS